MLFCKDLEDPLDTRQNGLPLLPASYYCLCTMYSTVLTSFLMQLLGHYRCPVPIVLFCRRPY